MANRIREYRRARGLSQAALGETLGFSKMKVSNQERGERGLPVEELYDYARALGCHPAELLEPPHALTAEEIKLIRTYRGLDAPLQTAVRRMVDGVAPSDPPAGDETGGALEERSVRVG